MVFAMKVGMVLVASSGGYMETVISFTILLHSGISVKFAACRN